ncbi:MAG TPA: SPFH domain-containing protein [Phycisphaerae bacterium]|jgi:membrane protease subunit HflK|nr:hypothetical protein [Phycisphaerae bacterium]HOB74805.1 SPFH domain-containing protein [Phycisphaerae bacterium]HOJ54360.1 SPFH domain-containing protein [Phycisphaerae bacterium]HOL26831.1 SPFH domain-containing protein [Phycisphaerae bacterium]HPP19992.1 SPFH domain-containing protein [Phycisphaerae bacterium]
MTNRLEPPLMDDHKPHVDDSHAGHDGCCGHDHALNVIEEPLDPASQSLSDALKASFRVLKVIMLVLVVLFLLSGVFSVGTDERVIVQRFGEIRHNYGPGLRFAWPYPIDEKIRVRMSPKEFELNSFWINLSESEKLKPLSDLDPRSMTLDPAKDGALLTGDHGIMHLQLVARYEITSPEKFVQNVSSEESLIRSVLENAAIAEAARSTIDELWKGKEEVASRIRARAQDALDLIESGITLVDLTAPKSYYPLQTKDAFINVSTAEQTKRDSIQGALSEQAKKLNGVAGEAWKKLHEQIGLLDQKLEAAQRQAVIAEINRILVEEAQGEAGGRIRMAQSHKQEIINRAEAEKQLFEAVLTAPEYQKNKELIRQRLRQRAISELFAQSGVSKWLMPAGDKQVMLWFNKDPVQAREAERAALKSKTEKK